MKIGRLPPPPQKKNIIHKHGFLGTTMTGEAASFGKGKHRFPTLTSLLPNLVAIIQLWFWHAAIPTLPNQDTTEKHGCPPKIRSFLENYAPYKVRPLPVINEVK